MILLIIAVIMAGGIGERLWPLSTRKKPKQFHIFGAEKTLIELTVERAQAFADKIYIVTTREQKALFTNYLPNFPQQNILIEPFRRNTAPAIALGCLHASDEDIIVVLPSDHIIRDKETFERTMNSAIKEASKNNILVTIGITPNSPHTGYGYIERGETFNSETGSFTVKKFHEKPSFDVAQRYVKDGRFYWNSGMFVWKKSSFDKALASHLKDINSAMKEIKNDYSKLESVYKGMPNISVDYGIMEKADNVIVIPANFYWNDVGSWDSVYDLEEKDENGNVVKGNFILHNVRNSLLVNTTQRNIGISHVEDMIVVVSNEGTLLCHRGETQYVREITKRLEEKA
ncbi:MULTISPECIES: mannose-1-phosphate guanylyltransferase [Kosmotoga]|uniref:mannose-1-phosphate guanylyltransferase n=1 Tax=Kosmotoga TaxID=651456 RepID=UPI001EEF794E|nr:MULTISPECIES: sugar phosphate nucleotidyltransferase [Kosmotoga]